MRCSGVLLIFTAIWGRTQPVPVHVSFQLTDLDYNPLPGETVRLVFGEGVNWRDPQSGTRFATGTNGAAQLTVPAILDKRWQWVPIGFTAFSVPVRTDHLRIFAELEQLVPLRENRLTLHVLYRMDIFRRSDGTCSTSDFTEMYTPDAKGRFTARVPPEGLRVPGPEGLVLHGQGYQSWDHLLEPDGEGGNGWKLKLAFKRHPPPVTY